MKKFSLSKQPGKKDSGRQLQSWNPLVLNDPPQPEAGSQQAGRQSGSSYKRVVAVAVDASDYAKRAFEYYLLNVRFPDDLVFFIHCTSNPKLPTISFSSPLTPPLKEWKDIMDSANKEIRDIENAYTVLCSLKKINFKMLFEFGKNVGEMITSQAEKENASMIVCGSKGTGNFFKGRGDVAESILKRSSVPVLLVPCNYNLVANA